MYLVFLAIVAIIIFFTLFISPPGRREKYTGGKSNVSVSQILDYLEEYIEETSGGDLLLKYLNNHYGYTYETLKEVVKKIINEHDISSITHFLERSRLKYADFLSDEYKQVIFSSDIKFDNNNIDYEKLLREAKNAAKDIGYSDYSESKLRSVLKRNIEKWKAYKIKRSKIEESAVKLMKAIKKDANLVLDIDPYVVRVYMGNYIECHLMPDEDKYKELRRLISDALSIQIPGFVKSYGDLLQFIREQGKYSYLKPPTSYYIPSTLAPTAPPTAQYIPPTSELEQLAMDYGLDLEVLKDYIRLYPDLTPKEIIGLIMQNIKGADDEHIIDLSDKAKALLEKIKKGEARLE